MMYCWSLDGTNYRGSCQSREEALAVALEAADDEHLHQVWTALSAGCLHACCVVNAQQHVVPWKPPPKEPPDAA